MFDRAARHLQHLIDLHYRAPACELTKAALDALLAEQAIDCLPTDDEIAAGFDAQDAAGFAAEREVVREAA